MYIISKIQVADPQFPGKHQRETEWTSRAGSLFERQDVVQGTVRKIKHCRHIGLGQRIVN
jgi:hypothetical protein